MVHFTPYKKGCFQTDPPFNLFQKKAESYTYFSEAFTSFGIVQFIHSFFESAFGIGLMILNEVCVEGKHNTR